MALLTWKSNFNNYDINLKFLCHYKNGSIIEFDSHDMSNNIEEVFKLMIKSDYQETIKMDFLELSNYLFNKLHNLYSVEFVSDKGESEYFREDINN